MATGVRAAEANEDLDALAAEYPWIKLHVGDPGAAGTANPATETDRVQATFGSASGGVIATNTETRWNGVAGSEDYTHWSGWTASTAGACGWSGTVTADAVTTGNNFVIPSGGLTFLFNVMA
ncbi:MAG: hypothetical protein WBA97_34635 [Actinophytocola sp.]|uniref:phage tail fiber protein n=1 Tax=Actinophytocola sp. TaxID=1872138 RepID=UPI003C749657